MKTGKYANWVILNQKPIHVANLSVVCASKMPIRPILKTYLDSCYDRNLELCIYAKGRIFYGQMATGKRSATKLISDEKTNFKKN